MGAVGILEKIHWKNLKPELIFIVKCLFYALIFQGSATFFNAEQTLIIILFSHIKLMQKESKYYSWEAKRFECDNIMCKKLSNFFN